MRYKNQFFCLMVGVIFFEGAALHAVAPDEFFSSPQKCTELCAQMLTGCVIVDGMCRSDYQGCMKACQDAKKDPEEQKS